jgi:hypothetical protein
MTVIRMKISSVAILAVLCVLLPVAGVAAEEVIVPVADGHLGSCSADFTVKDADREPVYDAKINVTLKYGFLGMRKLSLQVGTNSEGRARVAGLPDKPDKTFQFEITSGKLSKTVEMNTFDKCKATFEVVLGEK